MFLCQGVSLLPVHSLPRASGGVSVHCLYGYTFTLSSPREWGCFSLKNQIFNKNVVFPARVGVFPSIIWVAAAIKLSSPREWGCFQFTDIEIVALAVFPARVGVFPQDTLEYKGISSLPRASGGVSGVSH